MLQPTPQGYLWPMRRKGIGLQLAAVGVAAALALALAACGSATGGAAGTAAEPSPGTAARAAGPRESPCRARVGGFVHSLGNLRRRLVAGLTYQQYVSEIRAIRSTYDAVPVTKLGLICLTGVAGPAESSFNTYIAAGNDWGKCVGTPGCEAATVEPTLQRRWRRASRELSEAQKALGRGRPGDS